MRRGLKKATYAPPSGKELIESFMAEVHADGVKELKPWNHADPKHNRELRRVVSRGTEPLSPRSPAEPRRLSLPGQYRTVENKIKILA